MVKSGYIPIWDEERGENVLISYDSLDPEIAQRLCMVPPIGGFCYAVEDFKTLPLSTAPFYIGRGWLPKQGKAEIYAPAKSGKSYLCLHLARCIGSGEGFLELPTTQGRVLYMQFELGVEVLQQRMNSTGMEYPNVYCGTTFGMKLDKKAGQDALIKAMNEVRPQVLILDPFYKIFSGDENTAKDVEILVDFLDEVIDAFNCSILLVHHAGKDIKRGGRGSSILEGWVDSYIEMKKESKKGEPLRVKITPMSLRHSELPAAETRAEMVDFEFVLLDEDEKPQLIIDKVREYCEHHDEFKSSEIMKAGLGTRAPIQAALNMLIEEGAIERFKTGWYRRKEC